MTRGPACRSIAMPAAFSISWRPGRATAAGLPEIAELRLAAEALAQFVAPAARVARRDSALTLKPAVLPVAQLCPRGDLATICLPASSIFMAADGSRGRSDRTTGFALSSRARGDAVFFPSHTDWRPNIPFPQASKIAGPPLIISSQIPPPTGWIRHGLASPPIQPAPIWRYRRCLTGRGGATASPCN